MRKGNVDHLLRVAHNRTTNIGINLVYRWFILDYFSVKYAAKAPIPQAPLTNALNIHT